MKDYNNIVSLWVRGFTMEKENKADLCSVLVKLGLAVMSVAYPQTGSQASLASAGVDVVLSVVKSVGLLKGEKDDSIDGQLKECIANVLARIQGGRLSDTHRKLMENYVIPRYESWRGSCVKGVPADDIEDLFLEWTNTGEANREMYLTELDIRSIDDLFMVLFKEELLKHQGLADWYEMQQIESLDQRFNEVCNLFWGRMGTLEDRISKLEKPINPKIEEILRSNPRELLWEASKSVYEISKQEGQRFAYDIIDRLLPNGYIPKLTVPIEGKTEGGQSAPLAELCKAINDHVAIIGNGGTGKTTFLHYLIEQSFAQSPEKFSDLPVYIFIELNRCPTDIVHWHNDPSRKTKFITRYIGALLENHASLDTVDDRILEYVEKELQKRPDGGKPQYVLLLDGFNEVKIDEGYSIRSLLSNEISTIKKYDNVRIITTSRETQAAYYAAGFTNIRVTGLDDSVIIEHLRGCGKQEYFIAEVMNNKHLVECLRTPLYLCMFASSGENTLLPETQGEILYFFFHRNSSFYNIRKRAVETRTNPLNELQTQLVLDFILPYIGACFESEDIFSVNAGNFWHMILKSVEAVRELFLDAGSNPFVDFHYSKNCLQSTLDSLVEGDIVKTTDVIKCVFDYLGIIYQYQINEGSYVERVRYEEKTIFSTIMPSETVVDLSFSHNGDYVLITTQYKCVEFNLITGEEMIVARSAGQERFLYGNYSGKWIEVTVTEGSEEGLPTRCEFYSKVAKYAGFEFSKEWYYIVPYLPEELYTYYVHGNGDIGKEGPHDENGIQRYRLTRGFFLEDRPEFARILNPECYQVDGDSVTPLCFHFGKLEMICVRHKKALASQKGMENLITYMYLDEKMGEAILARDSADLAWVSNLSSATYEILWGVFDRHIGNDKGYYSWNYVAPWQNNKMIGCFETFHVTLIDRDIGELSVPVEYEPGLALAGCDFSNIRANDSVKELIKNTGGVI